MNRRILIGIICWIFASAISEFAIYLISLSGVVGSNRFYDWLMEYGGLGFILSNAILLTLSAVIGYSIAKLHRKILTAAGLTWILVLGIFIALAFVAR